MQTEQMKVTGMTCGGCVTNVTQALRGLSGVHDVKVALAEGEATVQYDEKVTSPDQLRSAVKVAGYGVGSDEPAKGGCCG